MVGNLRKEKKAAVSVLCLGRREIRGAVMGCVERSHADKSQQKKVLYCFLKTERWKIIWSFAFRALCVTVYMVYGTVYTGIRYRFPCFVELFRIYLSCLLKG